MFDDLRTRIIAAIDSVDDWRGVTDPAILADAVIAGLKTVRCWKCDNTVKRADDD